MNRLALGWLDVAIALEEENRELRAIISDLVVAICRNRKLVEYARCELEERWLDDEEKAA